LNCIFASDLHGKIKRYGSLFNILLNEIPDAVFLGGDLLPNQFTLDSSMNEFIEDKIFSNIERIINEIGIFLKRQIEKD